MKPRIGIRPTIDGHGVAELPLPYLPCFRLMYTKSLYILWKRYPEML